MKRTFRPAQQAVRRVQSGADVRLLTESEAAEHCRYFDRGCANPIRAFQKCARRLGIPVKHVGRTRLYDPRVLDAFMERQSWTSRHRLVKASA